MEINSTTADFQAPLYQFSKSLERFDANFKRLAELNDSITQLNTSLGQIFLAFELTAKAYNVQPPQPKAVPAPVAPASTTAKIQPSAASVNKESEGKAAKADAKAVLADQENVPAHGNQATQKGPVKKDATGKAQGRPAGKPKQPLFDARKILSRCPPKYQNPPHRNSLEAVLRLLKAHPDGLYQNDIVDSCGLNRNHCIEYLNMLLRIGDCVRENRKGFVYKLHPKHNDPVETAKKAPGIAVSTR